MTYQEKAGGDKMTLGPTTMFHIKIRRGGDTMKKIYLIIVILLFSLNGYAENFPLREKYTDVQPISTSDLHAEFEKATVIDTRSAFEYNIIRIQGAKNILVSQIDFTRLLEEKAPDKTAKIVFYCNGVQCAKSYKAVQKAAAIGYTNVFVYDAGVFEWTKTYPEKAVLLEKNPADIDDIIPESDFQSKVLDRDVFEKEAQSIEAYLIDTRDANQRKKTPEFARSAKRIPIDNLAKMLDDENFLKDIEGKTLYIMDAVGKQIQWIQYYLIAQGFNKYYFLKNGLWSFYGEEGASKDGVQQKNLLEDTDVRFKIKGHLL
ncbi:MAG: rhodanese-like domain-containing protein, partial [Candidatus Electrothrix sp. EH2]|nr:rhodanese-like domain-containing protein [Candidatus Electrothrix sp. EH2]